VQLRIRRQLASGLFFVIFGAVALWLGADMAVGTAADMGVGYVPRALAIGCIGVGLWQLGTGFSHSWGEVAAVNLRPMAFVVASIAGFAVVLPYAGLPVTVFLLVVAAAFSGEAYDRTRMLVTALMLAAGSALLFGVLLRLQIPLLPAMWRP
jgi:hypothetical protein